MRLPEFMRKGGEVQPHKAAVIKTLSQARKHIEAQGGSVTDDAPFEGKRFIVALRGFHHGGVPEEGVIHMADEDARTAKKAPKRRWLR